MDERAVLKKIPKKLWKGKFAIIKIGDEILKVPIENAEHYMKLKALRDNTRIFNTGRF